MRVCRLSTLDELAPYADAWDGLSAGVPFRSWDWMSCWWRHYATADAKLLVLGVWDYAGALVGVAPWYLTRSPSQGRIIRWLGSGEVCSDYLSVPCLSGMENHVTEALAEYLAGEDAAAKGRFHWDLLELSGVEAQDPVVMRLAEHLVDRGCAVDCSAGPNCWRIDLPGSWDDYLALLSKGHRKQLRRLERNVVDTGRAVLHTVQSLDELPRAADILMDLHQRRRRALGQPGCFASRRFVAFHREVMPRLLRNGQLQLHWLELDGKPVAAEYQVTGNGIIYAYQAGVDSQALEEEPGRLITLATLRRAIQQGCRAMDFLRGDEPYKAHFRAVPRPSVVLRVVPNYVGARLRHRLWSMGKTMKRWAKNK